MKNTTGHRSSILQTLSSVRLFFWLIGLILAACVVGAVVPQGEMPERYAVMFGAPAARLIAALGLHRVFSSAWFLTLLAGLGLNLAACSISRLKTIRSRPGVFVTHVAVLVILTGALVRAIFGEHGVLPLRVGEAAAYFVDAHQRERRLPFEIHLDRFEIVYWSGARTQYDFSPGDIRQFRSHLTAVENGRPAARKTIWVNEPFRHKGYTFYQSGYDPDDPQFSSLQVAKDPSVPIVYAGFALLPVGLAWSFLKNPKSEIHNPKSK